MASPRRYLLNRPRMLSNAEWEEALNTSLAACPAAAAYSEDEVLEFLSAAFYLDHLADRAVLEWLKENRLSYPAAFTFDPYRLSRHVLYCWANPEVRLALEYQIRFLDASTVTRIRRKRLPADLYGLVCRCSSPAAVWILQLYGLTDLVPDLLATLSPEEREAHRLWLQYGRLVMHQCLTEPPQPRSSQWDRQKLLRQIGLRDVQLRSMQKSIHRLRRERKSLLDRIRRAGAAVPPELGALAAELTQLRQARAEAEAAHRLELAALASRFDQELARVRAELAATAAETRDALALLLPWGLLPDSRPELPAPFSSRRRRWS